MDKFNQITNIIIQKYDNTKLNIIKNLMDKNKFFKYHSDDYVLSDIKTIFNKNRILFIDYLIPSSNMTCMIDCKILQSKKPLKKGTSIITHAKDFDDNIYVSIDKNDLQRFQISSFQESKSIHVSFKNQEQFIQSFNNALDQMIKYLEQQKTNHKILYYISKIAKIDPEEYIDNFIQKIQISKFQKSIIGNKIIQQQTNYSIQNLNIEIQKLYNTDKYKKQIFPYLNNKFNLQLERYLDICSQIYDEAKYEQWFSNTKIVYYYQQPKDDEEYERAKMEDNNICINHYGLILHLRKFKKQKVFQIYSNIYYIIPHELAHIADITNLLDKFSTSGINIDKQDKHSQTYIKQHQKICGQMPYED